MTDSQNMSSASSQIDETIKTNQGWKGDLLVQLRDCILCADPTITEEVKWKMATRPLGWPVWVQNGIVCFVEIWKDNVKLLFPNGAHLTNNSTSFNARLESKDIRAIEFKQNDSLDTKAVTELVRQAVQFNSSKKK